MWTCSVSSISPHKGYNNLEYTEQKRDFRYENKNKFVWRVSSTNTTEVNMGEAKRRQQTTAERHRLYAAGKDGMIFCCDLNDPQGQFVAQKLAKTHNEVRHLLEVNYAQDSGRSHLFVLVPVRARGVMVGLVHPACLREAVYMFHDRSRDFGQSFSVTIAPANEALAVLFTETQVTAGSA